MIWGKSHTRILVAVAGLGLALWAVNEHIQHIRAETTAQATEAAGKVSLQVIAQHDAENKAQLETVMKANQAQVDALRQTVLALKTPQQQIQWSQDQLAAALKGIQITLNPKTGEAQAVIPATTLPQLPQVIEECQTCKLNLEAANQKLTYAQQQHADDTQKLLLANQNADNWKNTAEGGTKWQRFKSNGKWGIIGGGAALALACMLGHCPH